MSNQELFRIGEVAKMYHRAAEERGLEAAGFSRELALIDNCISEDPETFVTEISIPVRPR